MKRWIIAAFLLLLAIALLLWWMFFQKADHADYLTLYGNVDVRQVDIGFRVAGRVGKLNFEEGDFVPAGALMAVLDKQPYADQVKQTLASVISAKTSFDNAELLLKRRQDLIKDGSVSTEDLQNAETNRDIFAANLQQAEAARNVALSNLSFTEAFSPTGGTILSRIREPGTVVNPADPVYTLSVTSPVWIRAYVHEPELGIIYPGMPADVFTDTKGGPVYKGRIGFISPVAEFTPKTVETTRLRTDLVYRLRIYADNPDKNLRQGMPVTVRLYPQRDKK